MPVTKITYQSREEWLALRRNYIGGSDAAAVVGLNPYKSALALYHEKLGNVPDFKGNIHTKLGTHLEDFVAQLFCEETGKKLRRENAMLVNDAYPFACADLDRRIVGENALLECKTTKSAPAMRKFRQGEYPESWYCQMTHYLAITGMERAYLAVLVNFDDFKYFTLERDDREIEWLMSAEREFAANLEAGIPPEPMGLESDDETLRSIYTGGGESVDLFPFSHDVAVYLNYEEQIKQLSMNQHA